jgi:hypothetical protein
MECLTRLAMHDYASSAVVPASQILTYWRASTHTHFVAMRLVLCLG